MGGDDGMMESEVSQSRRDLLLVESGYYPSSLPFLMIFASATKISHSTYNFNIVFL